MWKLKFDKDNYKTVERLDDKVTIVTIKAQLIINNLTWDIPIEALNECASSDSLKIQIWKDAIIFEVKGKAVRSDQDKDNPVLGERIAECKAKLKLYHSIIALLDRCVNYYGEKLVGKKGKMTFEEYDNNSIYANLQYFKKQWDREYRHWIKLLTEANKWD